MDADETRMRRYEEAIYSGDMTLGHRDRRKTRVAIARAVIAVADEEQAEIRARAEAAEADARTWLEVAEAKAKMHATSAQARGDFEEGRRWLDLLIMFERAADAPEA